MSRKLQRVYDRYDSYEELDRDDEELDRDEPDRAEPDRDEPDRRYRDDDWYSDDEDIDKPHPQRNQYVVDRLLVLSNDTHGPKRAYVVIVSYESANRPFENLDADMLAEFFTEWNNIRTGVRSYVIGAEGEWQGLVQADNYLKEVCDVAHVAEWQRENKVPTPVMFLLCHGSGPSSAEDKIPIPSSLSFGEERTEPGHMVYARAPTTISIETEWYWEEQIYLRDLIKDCGFVFLMCCHGEDIVNDYVSELKQYARVQTMPYIVFYKDKLIVKTTHCIVEALQ
jgi:hypothetical protein